MNALQEKLKDYTIILGSQSPRRKELLSGLDIAFEVRVKDTDESYNENTPLENVPLVIAENKFKAFIPELQDSEFLITADTIVIKENKILQKPKDVDEAKQILQFLSNGEHTVVTGVTYGTKKCFYTFSAHTQVTFAQLSQQDIEYYAHTYKPMDKAGAYGVQEWIGYVGIQKIEGSYFNVMGLPVQMLYQKLLAYEI
jgi:septum formation protein